MIQTIQDSQWCKSKSTEGVPLPTCTVPRTTIEVTETSNHDNLKGRNFGRLWKWYNLVEFHLADYKKIKLWQETDLADHQKIKYWQEFILTNQRNILPEVSINLAELVCSHKGNHIWLELWSIYLWKKTLQCNIMYNILNCRRLWSQRRKMISLAGI